MTEITSNESQAADNDDMEALTDEVTLETAETPAEELTVAPIPDAETNDAVNEAALKAAIDASGTVHLSAIYKIKVNESLPTTVANIASKIMTEAKRIENWTREETVAIWDRIESELKAIA